MTIIASVVIAVLLFLSGLHVYWALGGQQGMKAVLPERDGKPLFVPSSLSTLIVAAALLTAAGIVFGRISEAFSVVPAVVFRWGTWALAVVFLLRAMGEFRFVGFFKTVRGTKFARWDTRLFSPLCLALGALLVVIARS